jgi:hypothetical protein
LNNVGRREGCPKYFAKREADRGWGRARAVPRFDIVDISLSYVLALDALHKVLFSSLKLIKILNCFHHGIV